MSAVRTIDKMAGLLLEHMTANGITQAHLARLIGRSTKHVNQVLNGKAGTGELDYWAFVLGLRYSVALEEISDSPRGSDATVPYNAGRAVGEGETP